MMINDREFTAEDAEVAEESRCGLLEEHNSAYTGGEKLIGFHDEKMVDRDWLLRHDGAFCCSGVRSAARGILEHTRTSKPEFTCASTGLSSGGVADT